MTTQTEIVTEDIPIENSNQVMSGDYSANIEGMDANLGMTGQGIQSSIPMGEGLPFEAGTSQGGLVMGVGGGIEDNAVDVTYSTKTGEQGAGAFGTTQTTTTTTTTQYGFGQGDGNGLIMGVGGGVEDNAVDVTYSTKTGEQGAGTFGTTQTTITSTQYGLGETQGQIIQGDGNGLVMGVGGGIEDNAVDVTYSTKTGEQGVAGANTTTTTTTTTTQYGLGGDQGQIIQGEGSGLVMGVGGGVEDNAVDVTYSTHTTGLGAAAAKTTTTTTTTQYNLGQTEGQIIQGEGSGLVMGVGGGVEDNAVDVTYSTHTTGLGAAAAKTTTTTTTTETKYGGVRKSVDISKYATTQTFNEGVDIKSLEIYKKTTLLKDKVQHIIKREIQPIVKTIIKPIIQKEIQPIVQREIQPIFQKEIQPIVQKEIQPIIQKEIQPIVKKEIQPIIQKKN